ncbi:hypothetical protein BN1843_29020 [Escherichia coli]|nr:hypothetical protein BN1843_29020 [Escherichia coli]
MAFFPLKNGRKKLLKEIICRVQQLSGLFFNQELINTLLNKERK